MKICVHGAGAWGTALAVNAAGRHEVTLWARDAAQADAKAAFTQAGAAMDAAIEQVLANPATRTADIGGSIGTRAFTAAVVAALN